ncbi:hypothetical protein V6R21_23940 [Limibacter armeniacum]|uniref:hypothetical protein n=1 Tax=Limibacter armeniacum TaxID=466084 RepID=UPI002FE525FC
MIKSHYGETAEKSTLKNEPIYYGRSCQIWSDSVLINTTKDSVVSYPIGQIMRYKRLISGPKGMVRGERTTYEILDTISHKYIEVEKKVLGSNKRREIFIAVYDIIE